MSIIKRFLIVIIVLLVTPPSQVLAAKYPDWVFQDIPSAFVLKKGVVELAGYYLVVNDAIDVFNIRQKKLGNSTRFSGTIGDYSGFKGTINYGLTDRLMLHYSYQHGGMDIGLGTSSTFKDLHSSSTISTSSHNIGIRMDLLSEGPSRPAIAVEAGYSRNSSNELKVSFSGINSGGTIVEFAKRQDVRMSDLSDDGFGLRLLMSKTLSRSITPTIWLGYGRYTARPRLSTSITYVKGTRFDMTERVFSLGLGLGIQVFRRMPIFISYRHLTVNRDIKRDASSVLTRYVGSKGAKRQNSNNVFSAKVVYWLGSHISLDLEGDIFTNQFLGIIPHYDNPLTDRFLNNTYGYIGIGLGVIF